MKPIIIAELETLSDIETAIVAINANAGAALQVSKNSVNKRKGAMHDASRLQLLVTWARATENPYSTSPHFSKLMKEFLNKMFSRYQHPYGGAALEFAAALATGRLKLKKSDFDDVVNLAIDHLKSTPSALLGFLLLSKR